MVHFRCSSHFPVETIGNNEFLCSFKLKIIFLILRYPENFTQFLEDQVISCEIVDGKETIFINDLTIEEFLEGHSSLHEHIRNNVIDATRNFNHRVQKFLKIEVMNKSDKMPMPVRFYSYRVEFQARGSAHIHGVLWLDIEKIVQDKTKAGDYRFKHLQSAFQTIGENKIPNDEESEAVAAFCDSFVSVSLRNPEVKKIVEEVNSHHHTKTCRKAGTECRFHFPRFPSLQTFLAIPLRLEFEDEVERQNARMKINAVLNQVKDVLEDDKTMKDLCTIRSEEIEDLLHKRALKQRSSNILEDRIHREKIKNFNEDFDGETKALNNNLGNLLLNSLQESYDQLKKNCDELEKVEMDWSKERLLALLKKAKIGEVLGIDENLSEEERDSKLLMEYHRILQYSNKGFSLVLKRDINEVWVNNYNAEWIEMWNSNLDISPVFDYYAVVTYISDYFMKVIEDLTINLSSNQIS